MLTGRNSYHKMPYSPLWNFRRFWVGKIFFWKVTSRPNFMRGIRKWQWKILKKFFGGQKIEKNASKLGVVSFNPNKIIFRGNFIRGIDCAYSQSVKTLLWPWFREGGGCIEAKIKHFRILWENLVCFSLQYTNHLSWIRVKEAFSRFGNTRNRFPA